ncbi:MAG: glycosyltransferase family 39 protein [Anaerolineales bacterium]
MLAILPLIALAGLLILFSEKASPPNSVKKDWRDRLGFSLIIWGAILGISTEVLGALHQLNRAGVLIVWTLALAGILIMLYRKPRPDVQAGLHSLWDHVRQSKKITRLLLLLLLAIFTITLITAVLAPPQEGDALAYHMGRVVHWIQNQTLDPYPTPDSRQIWMPPWTEYGFTHFYLLSGSDQFVSLVQWIAMAATVVLVMRVAELLGADSTGQLLSGLFLVTIPVGISQASGALTDYALSMWVVLLVWLIMLCTQSSLTRRDWIYVGLALGGGVLTKSNYVLFAIPLVVMLEWNAVRRLKWMDWVVGNIITVIISLTIVLPSWFRNLRVFGSILGAQEQIELHRNVSPWLLTIFSDAIRTFAMRLATPLEAVNIFLYKSVYAVHEFLGVLPSDPAITYHGKSFFVHWAWPGEDAAVVHTLLLVLAAFFYLLHRASSDHRPARRLLFLAVLSYVAYSVMFKWQGNARFYLPFYAAAAAPVGYMLSAWSKKWLQGGAVALLVMTALPVLMSHHTRPLIPFPPQTIPQSILLTDRDLLTFQGNTDWLASYRSIADRIHTTGCISVGLRIDSSDLEYPWWVVLTPFERDIRIEHLLIYPGLETTSDPSFTPCAVICTICDEKDQELKGLELIQVDNDIYLFE